MVNGLHLYSAFIQSAVQFMPLIHPFTHTFTHQRRLAAMQGTNQLVRSNWGLRVLLRDTSTRPGWDRTGNPPTARRQLYLLSHIAILCLYSNWFKNSSCLIFGYVIFCVCQGVILLGLSYVIHKAYSPTELSLTGCFLFYTKFARNHVIGSHFVPILDYSCKLLYIIG